MSRTQPSRADGIRVGLSVGAVILGTTQPRRDLRSELLAANCSTKFGCRAPARPAAQGSQRAEQQVPGEAQELLAVPLPRLGLPSVLVGRLSCPRLSPGARICSESDIASPHILHKHISAIWLSQDVFLKEYIYHHISLPHRTTACETKFNCKWQACQDLQNLE